LRWDSCSVPYSLVASVALFFRAKFGGLVLVAEKFNVSATLEAPSCAHISVFP
jgi:hypothetical protein